MDVRMKNRTWGCITTALIFTDKFIKSCKAKENISRLHITIYNSHKENKITYLSQL